MDSKIIWNNILCNLTGKADSFRAIDWLVEHNNLYIKVSHSSLVSQKLMCSPYFLAYLWWKIFKSSKGTDYC